MDHFNTQNGSLFGEEISLEEVAASFGTPTYVYSRATIEHHWHSFDDVFEGHEHLVCYAVKANSNLAVLNILARLGSGFDIVSGGELERVVRAGGDPGRVVFSGVAKRADEIRQALDAGICSFNVESESELRLIDAIAGQQGKFAPVSLRINPDIDARTHPYISTGLKENKFGIDFTRASDVFRLASTLSNVDVVGLDCHIGSQLTETAPFVDALDRLLVLISTLGQGGIAIRHIDVGGGLGIRYRHENPPQPQEYVAALLNKLGDAGLKIIIEPGRAIVGNAGVLLTRIEHLKRSAEKNFAIVDAGMNDLLRPALYDAWQEIIPVTSRDDVESQCYDVVGPVCETGDFLGKDRVLAVLEGDLLAVRSAGAYGFTMSSNYNSRLRAAEVMVDGHDMYLIREREKFSDLFAGESLLP